MLDFVWVVAGESAHTELDTWVFNRKTVPPAAPPANHDKLGLVIHARNSMLLVDSGRFAYQGTDLSAQLHRQYASNTSAHNTLTIDGCDQQALPAVATAPIPAESCLLTPAFDAAYGNMSLYQQLEVRV
jgi:hypothetical protein